MLQAIDADLLEAVDAVVDSQSGHGHSVRSPRSPKGHQGIIGTLLANKNRNNSSHSDDNHSGDHTGASSYRGRVPTSVQRDLSRDREREREREDLTDRDYYNPKHMTPRTESSRLPSLPLHTPTHTSNNISSVGNTINRSIHNAIVNNGGHPSRPGTGSRMSGGGPNPRVQDLSPNGEMRATIGEKVRTG